MALEFKQDIDLNSNKIIGGRVDTPDNLANALAIVNKAFVEGKLALGSPSTVGTAITVGKLLANTTIASSELLSEVLLDILYGNDPAVYLVPTITASTNAASPPYEVGQNIANLVLTSAYVLRDASALAASPYRFQGTDIVSPAYQSGATYTLNNYKVKLVNSWTVTLSYLAATASKYNSRGVIDLTGQFGPGTVTSAATEFTGIWPFFHSIGTVDPGLPTTSANVRALTKVVTPITTGFKYRILASSSTKYFVFCVPGNVRATVLKNYATDISASFLRSVVTVADASNSGQTQVYSCFWHACTSYSDFVDYTILLDDITGTEGLQSYVTDTYTAPSFVE